jgi:hypothetical protein
MILRIIYINKQKNQDRSVNNYETILKSESAKYALRKIDMTNIITTLLNI